MYSWKQGNYLDGLHKHPDNNDNLNQDSRKLELELEIDIPSEKYC